MIHPSDFAALQAGHEELKVQVRGLSTQLEDNTKVTNSVKEDTATIVEVMKALGGLVKLAGWISTGLVKLAPLGIAAGMCYAAYLGAKARIFGWFNH